MGTTSHVQWDPSSWGGYWGDLWGEEGVYKCRVGMMPLRPLSQSSDVGFGPRWWLGWG